MKNILGWVLLIAAISAWALWNAGYVKLAFAILIPAIIYSTYVIYEHFK
jgi:zona occludens toxin (predicted ATPase)